MPQPPTPTRASWRRRWLVPLVTSLIAGAAVTWTVALGCGLWMPPPRVNFGAYVNPSINPERAADIAAIQRVAEQAYFEYTGSPTEFSSQFWESSGARAALGLTDINLSSKRTGVASVIAKRVRSGWPVPCLEGYELFLWNSKSGAVRKKWRTGSWTPPTWLHSNARTGTPPFVPVRVRPTQFALDTCIHAAILFTLFAAPWALFARRRTRAGLCLSCGYDRQGLPAASPCPECGSPTKQPHSQ